MTEKEITEAINFIEYASKYANVSTSVKVRATAEQLINYLRSNIEDIWDALAPDEEEE